MKVRNKENKQLCSSSKFEIHGMRKIIVMFPDPDPDVDSDYITNYEIYLEKTKCWKDMAQAFRDKDLIIDNRNVIFFEPRTEEDRTRGYAL